MPELPEVETTVRNLNKNRALKILNARFLDVWTDTPKIIHKEFNDFRKSIKGKKILKVWRRGKNIILDLSGGFSLLIHQKLTGHLLIGHWSLINNHWQPKEKGPLEEQVNRYIHLMFWLSNDLMLALSDLRKFAKVELWKTKELLDSKEFKKLGPEPLEKDFTFGRFKEILANKKGKIKQVLMNQEIIAGIGNIYSDEALWQAKINPFKDVSKLNQDEFRKLYSAIQQVLKIGIKLGGESFSDYRTPEGKKGNFDAERKVYRREGEKCRRCGTIIKRVKISGRSAYYCPNCQKP